MAIVLAIDPGPAESAFVQLDTYCVPPLGFGKLPNDELLAKIYEATRGNGSFWPARCSRHAWPLVVEMIASYGMPVGAEVFETCVWIGRFIEAWKQGGSTSHQLLYRRDVKLHLCGQARAKDGNVRQALIDRYGGKDKAIGRKATPGPLYGISADVWQALAVAVTYSETRAAKEAA